MYRGKWEAPRKPKLTERTKDRVESFILGVISGLTANLITSLFQRWF